MTFTEFMTKYLGKYIDTDNYPTGNKFQCMDLMHQYCVEVLGITDGRVLAAPYAKDVYNNFDKIYGKEYFERIPNTPTGVPKEGDIVVWGTGAYGHIAIFVEGDIKRFRSFDQNYPTGSPCHIQEHTYSGVLGWLHCVKKGVSAELEECLRLHTQLVTELEKLKKDYSSLQQIKQELQTELDGVKEEVKYYHEFKNKLAEILKCTPDEAKIIGEVNKCISYEDLLRKANGEIFNLQNELNLANQQKIAFEEQYKNAELINSQQAEEIKKLNKKIEELLEKLAEAKQKFIVIFKLWNRLVLAEEVN